MRIGLIIPDKNDRPEFLANCLRMIEAQTVKPEIIRLVNEDSPYPNEKDITWRYRTGYDSLRNQGLDCILFIENDDYYTPDYIATITQEWEHHGRPELFGINHTWYYNLAIKKYVRLEHFRRSTMACSLIKPDLDINWPADTEPYTDSWLWQRTKLTKLCVKCPGIGFIGIKHGIGTTGGEFHSNKFDYYERFGHADTPEMEWLSDHMDEESFKFYSNVIK